MFEVYDTIAMLGYGTMSMFKAPTTVAACAPTEMLSNIMRSRVRRPVREIRLEEACVTAHDLELTAQGLEDAESFQESVQ